MNPRQLKRRNRRPGRPLIESLEARTLMSMSPPNVFARVDGLVPSGPGGDSVTLDLTAGDFTIKGDGVNLGFLVKGDAGDGLVPAAVQVFAAGNVPVKPTYARNGSASDPESVVDVRLAAGTYSLVVSGAASSGAYEMDVFLAGDVDGNREDDKADGKALLADLGAVVGDPRYAASADANLDGRSPPTTTRSGAATSTTPPRSTRCPWPTTSRPRRRPCPTAA